MGAGGRRGAAFALKERRRLYYELFDRGTEAYTWYGFWIASTLFASAGLICSGLNMRPGPGPDATSIDWQ